MFSAQLNELSLLTESMSAIAEIIDETELLIGKDGIRMVAADRAVVAVVDFSISKDAFAEYNYTGDARIGLNLINLLRILRRAGPTDVLRLTFAENRLELKLVGDALRTFKIPVIDVSKQELPPLDKLEFSSTFEIDSSVLNSGIDDADLITDSIVFAVTNNRVMMRAESESASFELELTPETPGLRNLKLDGAARSRYSLDYLKRIIKAKKMSDSTKIHLSTEYPMRLLFDVPGKATLAFVLAPRREE